MKHTVVDDARDHPMSRFPQLRAMVDMWMSSLTFLILCRCYGFAGCLIIRRRAQDRIENLDIRPGQNSSLRRRCKVRSSSPSSALYLMMMIDDLARQPQLGPRLSRDRVCSPISTSRSRARKRIIRPYRSLTRSAPSRQWRARTSRRGARQGDSQR